MVRCEEYRRLGLSYDVWERGQRACANALWAREGDLGTTMGRAAWGSVMRWAGTDGDWRPREGADLNLAIVSHGSIEKGDFPPMGRIETWTTGHGRQCSPKLTSAD